MRARLIVFPPLWFMDSYDPDRSYALTSHSEEEFIEGLTDATWKGPDSNSNLAKSAPPSGTPLFFFNASTRRSWVIRGTGVREHSYFSARMCTREKSVRFFLLRRKKRIFFFRKIGCRTSTGAARRTALRHVPTYAILSWQRVFRHYVPWQHHCTKADPLGDWCKRYWKGERREDFVPTI